ncbi:hypothetical protein BJX66DRAFT_341681 [Aspergillus keveii]|uniref:DUF7907 domain-containing protein n=1 Tax=Aspergillus keveii TaxID=714993 RepID=A0ABR4FUJ4_9EURO
MFLPCIVFFTLLALTQHVHSYPRSPSPTQTQTTTPTPQPYRYYLRSTTNLYLSSSITYNGRTNYVLLTNASLAQPLTLYEGDGSITLDTSNVIGASSEAPLYLSDEDGMSAVYKQVVLGNQKGGQYTKGFGFAEDGGLRLGDVKVQVQSQGQGLGAGEVQVGGFVACTAALGVKQVYWFKEGDVAEGDVPVVCEVVGFERVWEV